MTIYVRWLVENQVLLTHFVGEIDHDQIVAYLDKSFAMRDAANKINGKYGHLVHTVTDASGITKQNMDLKTGQEMMATLRKQRVGWSLYVGRNKIETFLASLVHQFGGIRFRTFDDLEQSIAFLKESDDTLREPLSKNLNLDFVESSKV